MSLLTVERLQVRIHGQTLVSDLSFTLGQGQTLALVGESGSGKSVSSLALLGLFAGEVSAQTLRFNDLNLLSLSPRARRQLLGKELGLIAQDPSNALNPSLTVGYQLKEVLAAHLKLKGAAATQKAIELLERVEIPAAKTRLNAYAHELSGGMNQRVAIAMALACEPKLLIADEPTTALDVTVQKQVLGLLKNLQREQQMALLLVTHDLAVVAQYAERVCVMYAGQWVEQGEVAQVLHRPQHPYTQALLNALPENAQPGQPLASLAGQVAEPSARGGGCLFAPRCAYQQPICLTQAPAATPPVRCFFPRNTPCAHC